MTGDMEMTIDERRKYLCQMQVRYRTATRRERSQLLDEMAVVTGMHRKSLTRLMGGSLKRRPRQRQRGRTYGPEVLAALLVIAESLDWICAERLTPQVAWMARHLSQQGELQVSPQALTQLGQISISTVRRMLASRRPVQRRLPQRGPETAHRLRRMIPAERIAWQQQEPGHFEIDLVHHCGETTAGQYVHTLQWVDVATGWSERVAVLGRSYRVMQDAFERVLARLPFPVRELHSDNGSEFLNDHLVRFWHTQHPTVRLSRSRPWRKNDNRFVEQKNSTLVRAYLGQQRLDTVEQTRALNQLYEQMGLYYNSFQPVLRLTEKIVCPASDDQPTRHKRRFSPAQTPLDRLLASAGPPTTAVQRWLALRQATNPRQLRHDLYRQLEVLFTLPPASPDLRQDVFATLQSATLA